MPAELGARLELEVLLDTMEQRQDEISTDVATRLLAEVDGYHLWQSSDLSTQFFDQCRRHLRLLIRMARTGHAPRSAELDFVRQVAIRRADELSPLHSLLQGYRVGHRVIWEWIIRNARATQDGLQAALLLTAAQLDYQDLVSSVLVMAYLEQAQRVNIEAERLKRSLLEDLLGGRVALRERAAARAAAMGLDPGAGCVVVVATLLGPRHPDPNALRWVADALQRHVGGGPRPPFVVARRHEVVGVIGIDGEGAGRIRRQVEDVLAMLRRTRIMLVAVGLSTPCKGIAEFPGAYDEASRALRHAGQAGGVVAIGDIPPFEYLLGCADSASRGNIPDWAHRLIEEDGRESGVLVDTLMAYLKSDMRIAPAAERLSVHTNTVQNRLRKIRQTTGMNTRHFEDVLQLITAVRLLKAYQSDDPRTSLEAVDLR